MDRVHYPNKAVIYGRVASKGVQENEIRGEEQDARCRAYAQSRGYQVVGTFYDEGQSGNSVERPQLASMLAFLAKHKRDGLVVLVDDIARVARTLKAYVEVREAIHAAGATIESPSLQLGDGPAKELFENIIAARMEYEGKKQTSSETV